METVMARILETISDFFVGVDLGQKQDFTALCIVERAELMFDVRDLVTWECKRETRFELRYMERVKLRTPYPAVVERIREVVMALKRANPAPGGRRTLVVDATGVGAPVVDLLRASKMDCDLVAAVITGGDSSAKTSGAKASGAKAGDWRVPKRDLIVGLQLMFDLRQLRIARGLPDTEILMKELMGMRVKMSAAGHESYGSGREGPHDDLVMAVALACWRAKKPVEWNWFGGRPGVA
jgi:hypothetical protein